jgi:hypothetical protein
VNRIQALPCFWRSLKHIWNIEKRGEYEMSNTKLHNTKRGDERLMRACLIVDRLCAEPMSSSGRLEAKLARMNTQRAAAGQR